MLKQKTLLGLGTCLLIAGAASAQQATMGRLTAQEYIEIQQLVTRYAYALDSGADNGYMYADLFAPDGEFHGPPARPGGKPFDAVGRDQLAAMVRPAPGSQRSPAYVSHFLSNHLIEQAPDGVTGKEYLLVLNVVEGKPVQVSMGGHYEDVYVKTPQGWRFKTRVFTRSTPGTEPPRVR
jgi:actinorhodin biosynthesis protein ActVIA